MSRLIKWIRGKWSEMNMKTDGLLFSNQKFASIFTKRRVGIAGITTVTTYLTSLAVKVHLENKDKIENKEIFEHYIYNLDELVKKRAREMYESEGKRRMFGKEDLRVVWNGVKVYPDKIYYTRLVTLGADDMFKVLFKTVFKNESDIVQEHRLQATRQTRYLSECFLTAGFSFKSDFGLNLPAPMSIANTGGFSTELIMKNSNKTSKEKQDTWNIEDLIKIPKRSTITITVNTREKKTEFEFETRVGFKGKVEGRFYNKNRQILHTAVIPIGEIITNAIPTEMRETTGDIDYIKIRGKVKYTHDVEHDIKIS